MAATRAVQVCAVLLVVVLQLLMRSGVEGGTIYHKARPRLRPWNIFSRQAWIEQEASVSGLEYYVQVVLGDVDLQTLIDPINTTTSNNFGSTQLFAFNVTEGPDADSTQLGYMRGYTVEASYTSSGVGVEVEILSYNDGTINGTVSIQGLIVNGPNEVAVVGGTGDFRGVSGYGLVAFVNATDNIYHFYHQLYFL